MKIDPGLAGRLIEQEHRFGVQDRRPLDLVCARADGVHVWDVQGRRYLDCLAGEGTLHAGHTQARIASALVEQGLRLATTCGNLRNDRLPPFLEKVCTLSGFETARVLGGESEALAAALLAAGRWGARHRGVMPGSGEVLVFAGHDHGHGAPLLGPADPSDGSSGPVLRQLPQGDLTAAREAVGPRTCAILVEPVGGRSVQLPPRGFLKGLRELCDGSGLLLLADETRPGLGRTGRLFAFEHEAARPDLLILGNGLTGGVLPMGALLAPRALASLFEHAQGQTTCAGNPLACAVASAALAVLVEEHLADRAAELGAYLLARLQALDSPHLQAVRGLGLWAGLDVGSGAASYREALAEEGLLCGGDERLLTLSPPLVITREQLDWAVEKLERVLGR
jgi:ornithine--oxo-acid transaminase